MKLVFDDQAIGDIENDRAQERVIIIAVFHGAQDREAGKPPKR